MLLLGIHCKAYCCVECMLPWDHCVACYCAFWMENNMGSRGWNLLPASPLLIQLLIRYYRAGPEQVPWSPQNVSQSVRDQMRFEHPDNWYCASKNYLGQIGWGCISTQRVFLVTGVAVDWYCDTSKGSDEIRAPRQLLLHKLLLPGTNWLGQC